MPSSAKRDEMARENAGLRPVTYEERQPLHPTFVRLTVDNFERLKDDARYNSMSASKRLNQILSAFYAPPDTPK